MEEKNETVEHKDGFWNKVGVPFTATEATSSELIKNSMIRMKLGIIYKVKLWNKAKS